MFITEGDDTRNAISLTQSSAIGGVRCRESFASSKPTSRDTANMGTGLFTLHARDVRNTYRSSNDLATYSVVTNNKFGLTRKYCTTSDLRDRFAMETKLDVNASSYAYTRSDQTSAILSNAPGTVIGLGSLEFGVRTREGRPKMCFQIGACPFSESSWSLSRFDDDCSSHYCKVIWLSKIKYTHSQKKYLFNEDDISDPK